MSTPLRKLTEKKENFCEKLVELGDKSAAYRAAYNAENMSPASIGVTSCRLAQEPAVANRIAELRLISRKSFEIGAAQKKKWLLELIGMAMQRIEGPDGTLKHQDAACVRDCIKELNRMDGDIAPARTLNANIDMTQEQWLKTLE